MKRSDRRSGYEAKADFITKNDLGRLEELLAVAGSFNYRDRKDLQSLETELQRAKIVDSNKIPDTVVTMNTRLVFRDLADNSKMEVTLVFPSAANIDQGKMSVLSPIGMAITTPPTNKKTPP